MRKNVPYYIGLSYKTNSIGWAVTDKDYNLLRANNKTLWGVNPLSPTRKILSLKFLIHPIFKKYHTAINPTIEIIDKIIKANGDAPKKSSLE